MSVQRPLLPTEIVLAPQWWYKNAGIAFDADFFYNPRRRVEAERKMEQVLYERFGRFGLGEDRDKNLPVIGAVHLAAGFLISEMLGCRVAYQPDAPPQVIPADWDDLDRLDAEAAFQSPAWHRVVDLAEALTKSYGTLVGDINWGGVLNVALDLRGQNLFMDMCDKPDTVKAFFNTIAAVLSRFTQTIYSQTGTSSISVNRTVKHVNTPVFLHSECSHTMISVADYERFLMDIDAAWSTSSHPFGIHYCGTDPHRYAESFAKLPRLDFLDVGWGGDIKTLRRYLPRTFFNIRLSPVEMADQSPEEIRNAIIRLVSQSGSLERTGLCCINMDEQVTDDKIAVIFETAEELRKSAF